VRVSAFVCLCVCVCACVCVCSEHRCERVHARHANAVLGAVGTLVAAHARTQALADGRESEALVLPVRYVSIRQHESAYVRMSEEVSRWSCLQNHQKKLAWGRVLGTKERTAADGQVRSTRTLHVLTCQYLYFCTSKASKDMG
jgi:hypothetical protein